MKKYLSLLLVFSFALAMMLTGCGGKEPITVTPPSWETEDASSHGFNYKIPAGWVTTEDTTGQNVVIYIPGDADLTVGSSSVNILKEDAAGQKATSFEDMKEALETSLESQLVSNGFDSVENLTVTELEAPIGTLCKVSYDSYVGGMKFSQVQYYPLIDDCIVVITSTDIGEGVTPSVAEAAEYMAMTLEVAE